ncbi:MAG: LysR substrate-binding domain-containing protein [Hyphomicrobiaceae bacterium]
MPFLGRWGDGGWEDATIDLLFSCPAWPVGNGEAFDSFSRLGLEATFDSFTLLHDRDDSNARSHWYEVADLPFLAPADMLIIPDPNVRVQAVIDGQGVALNDALVEAELEAGTLFRLSEYELSDYGYFLAYPAGTRNNPDVEAFADWLKACS